MRGAQGACQAGGAGVDRQELGGRGLHAAGRDHARRRKGADVFCGTWQQPSARVRSGGPGSAAELAQLATASQWRSGIDIRFRCDAPVATTILGGSPAELMQCTQRVGGWAHVAMVALVNNAVWYADGVLPAAQVMERSIGVLAGVERADTVAADLGRRCAAGEPAGGQGIQLRRYRPVRRADGGRHARQPGGQSRLRRRAPSAPRSRCSRRRWARTIRTPSTALMSLALQLSNEGRYAEADALFADADKLAPGCGRCRGAGAAAALSRPGCDEPGPARAGA